MSAEEDLQREITRAALRALQGTGFALAGSGAIREHGLVAPPARDVDLFTSDPDVAAFDSAVSALYSRAEARDYLDVDAIRASGKFTDDELIGSAAERDAGFEVAMFARQLDQMRRLTPERVAEYRVAAQLDAIRVGSSNGRRRCVAKLPPLMSAPRRCDVLPTVTCRRAAATG